MLLISCVGMKWIAWRQLLQGFHEQKANRSKQLPRIRTLLFLVIIFVVYHPVSCSIPFPRHHWCSPAPTSPQPPPHHTRQHHTHARMHTPTTDTDTDPHTHARYTRLETHRHRFLHLNPHTNAPHTNAPHTHTPSSNPHPSPPKMPQTTLGSVSCYMASPYSCRNTVL